MSYLTVRYGIPYDEMDRSLSVVAHALPELNNPLKLSLIEFSLSFKKEINTVVKDFSDTRASFESIGINATTGQDIIRVMALAQRWRFHTHQIVQLASRFYGLDNNVDNHTLLRQIAVGLRIQYRVISGHRVLGLDFDGVRNAWDELVPDILTREEMAAVARAVRNQPESTIEGF